MSFETGIRHLGGGSLFLGEDVGWGQRESQEDFAQVLSRYVDAIVCRANSHRMVEELASHSRCPVINGLTDRFHPCQALADVLTIYERKGTFKDQKVAYVGDSNNVARSLVLACGKLGVPCVVASPTGYQFDKAFLNRLMEEVPENQLEMTSDPVEAVHGATIVYTDVWVSMGQEKEETQRAKDLAAYQVNGELMLHAAPDAAFLHCLPAQRGLEVTAEIIDGSQSVIYEQAENRLHAQKGLLAWLLAGQKS